jgi:general secretion pathway protein J
MKGIGARGFTLVELLVAITIFSILAVMAYGGLNSVLHARQAIEVQSKRLQALQQTMLFLSRDLSQLAPRAIRDEYGERQPPLLGQTDKQPGLEFTHAGWSNPAWQPRSTLQRVSYVIEDQQLIRYSWTMLDRAPDSKPYRFPLLDRVLSMKLRFMDAKQNWQLQWPLPSTDPATQMNLPQAVEVVVELEDLGTVRRLFVIDGMNGSTQPAVPVVNKSK